MSENEPINQNRKRLMLIALVVLFTAPLFLATFLNSTPNAEEYREQRRFVKRIEYPKSHYESISCFEGFHNLQLLNLGIAMVT